MISITQGNALQDLFLSRYRKQNAARKAALRKLKTAEDAARHVNSLREKAQKCFHAPAERTPLNSRITGKLDFPEFTLEEIK